MIKNFGYDWQNEERKTNTLLNILNCIIRAVSLGYGLFLISEIVFLTFDTTHANRIWTGDYINDAIYVILYLIVIAILLTFALVIAAAILYVFILQFIWRGLFQKKNDVFYGVLLSIFNVFKYFLKLCWGMIIGLDVWEYQKH